MATKGANRKIILGRYTVFTAILVIIGCVVIGRAGYMMFFERHYWETVASRFIKENIPIKPTRGNIISADGKLMASSLPEYRIYLDCTANKDDDDPEFDTRKLLLKNVFKISEGLHQIFPDKSAREFRLHLEKGIWKNSKSWLIYPTRISFMGRNAQTAGWILFVIVTIFVVTAVSNGANLNDGMDGMAAGNSAIIGVTLGILAYVSSHIEFASYLNIMYIPGTEELVIFICAFIGALIGFLWYNAFPAQIFMGDMGSLTIGGIIAVFAIIIHKELLIPILCGVFLIENLSVIM